MTARPCYLRIVDAARPPCPRRIEVLLHVYDWRTPYGRSRPFKIKEADLNELMAAAERLEARR